MKFVLFLGTLLGLFLVWAPFASADASETFAELTVQARAAYYVVAVGVAAGCAAGMRRVAS